MQQQSLKTPIYLVCGFLESGKTSLMKNMLTDEGFSSGERTVLIVCEEGIEEYDDALLKDSNTVMVPLDGKDALNDRFFFEIEEKYAPERILIEYNSLWTVKALFATKKPETWELAQMVALVDATTFDNYLTNMRNVVSECLQLADLIIVNRCTPDMNKSACRKLLKGMNATANIMFENTDGSIEDGVGAEELPYDLTQDIIRIGDDDFGVWYIDAMEHPDRYDGKVVRVKGMAYDIGDLPPQYYVFGRAAMTCCVDDIGVIGFICRQGDKMPGKGQWIELTAKCKQRYSPLHKREAIVLIEGKVKAASKPKEELVTFR